MVLNKFASSIPIIIGVMFYLNKLNLITQEPSRDTQEIKVLKKPRGIPHSCLYIEVCQDLVYS